MAVTNDSNRPQLKLDTRVAPTKVYPSNVQVEVVGASYTGAATLSFFEQASLNVAKTKDPIIGQMQVASQYVDTNKFDQEGFDKYVRANNIHGFPVVIFRDVWSGEELGRVTGLVNPDEIAKAGKKVVAGQHPNVVVRDQAVDLSEK